MLLRKICIIASKVITVAQAAIKLAESIAVAVGFVKRKTYEARQMATEVIADATTEPPKETPENVKEAFVAVVFSLGALLSAIGFEGVLVLMASLLSPGRRLNYVTG